MNTTLRPLPSSATLTPNRLVLERNGARLQLASALLPRLSVARHRWRHDVAWWRYRLGEDDPRFAAPEWDDTAWTGTENLLLRRPNSGEAGPVPHVYDGVCWFRQAVPLPAESTDLPLTLCFGGCNREDWHRLALFVNGHLLGEWNDLEPHHTPLRLTLPSDDPRRTAFFVGGDNIVALRACGLDRRLPGLAPEAMRIFLFEHYLCEQWLCLGEPTEGIADWETSAWRESDGGYRREAHTPGWRLKQELVPDDAVPLWRLRQSLERTDADPALLLDVCLLQAGLDTPPEEGEPGHPLSIGSQAFVAVEHTAGVPLGWPDNRRLELWHHPGARVATGDAPDLPDVLLSVDGEATPHEQFHRYLRAHAPRRAEPIAVYDPYGCNDYGFGTTAREREFDAAAVDRALEQVDRCAKHGLRFDYFVLDVGWTDPAGDFRRAKPELFPDGLGAATAKLRQRGLKPGLWFATSAADWGIGHNHDHDDCRQPGPDGSWPPVQALPSGVTTWDFGRCHCLASRYADTLEQGVLHHVRENGVRLVKLDTGNYYCNATHHGHLPGKYSVTAMHDRLIRLARRLKTECPEVFIVWYWGIRSPFFLLHGETLFESRLGMEGSNFSDTPCWHPRDCAMRNIDLACQATPWIPPLMKDTLGLWLANTPWGNHLPATPLDNAAALEAARGHLIFPQIWGDLALLSDAQIRILADRQDQLHRQTAQLLHPRRPVGDPLRDDRYGYAYGPPDDELRLLAPRTSVLRPDVVWFEQTLPASAIEQHLAIAPVNPTTGRALLLVRALDDRGEPVRLEHREQWPDFMWAESTVDLEWERTWPARRFVWKGCSWRAWLSEPATLAHLDTALMVRPPSRASGVAHWHIVLGAVHATEPS